MPLTDIDGQRLGDSVADKLGNRNLVINGDMRIDQRNSGSSVTYPAGTAYSVDRFLHEKHDMSTLAATIQQVSDSPAGFKHSLKTTVTTTETASGDDRFVGADHRIEGYNWAQMGFGTADAKAFTMSFYVKSSVQGTYPISFFNAGVDRAFLTTYTISASEVSTWVRKTITVPGDTSGTWNTTNGIGLGVQMALGTGSNDHGTAGTTWGSTYKRGTSATVNLNETLNATWQITGVQIEVGNTATPFEHRSYGDELARCLRYYELLGNCTGRTVNTSDVDVLFLFKVEKRATATTPSSLRSSPGTIAQFGRAAVNVTALNSVFSVSTTQIGANLTTADTGITGGLFAGSISGAPILEASAEL